MNHYSEKENLQKANIQVRGLEISPPLLLAPMAGLTHSALRTTIQSCGGIGLLSTEMLAAWRLPNENATVSPFLFRTKSEKPLSYQILINDVSQLEPAVQALHRLQADAIDINIGCPAPRVRKAGGGSALVEKPQLLRDILSRARNITEGPLTAKIRLGDGNEAVLKPFCQMLVDQGVDMLSIHARLQGESFARKPHWSMIAEIKKWVNVPVIANGGIDSVNTARACLDQSGADGLMIGRAAAAKPWLFAEIARDLYNEKGLDTNYSKVELYNQFCKALNERFRIERRLGRLKEFTHYFATNYAYGHHLASKVQASNTMEQAVERAQHFFSVHDPEGFARVWSQPAD
ncbi:tRNA-dihydrouridine synthase family protein [Desulfogranum japonicum]|uniref:tRNA-dihydrouridine synthase family protein n=1 Tax=Desulfogranum japonicum TaxID=231447 RepID=UPI0006867D7D|nr:tRNA-dihydrouridine synthase family protein [Desulfogranum japonicum]